MKAKAKPKVKITQSQESKQLERNQKEQSLLADIQKKFGEGIIGKAGDIGYRSLPRLPTGLFALDLALGGGWAKHRMNIIWGSQSSCKTYLMLKMIALVQKLEFYTNLPFDGTGRKYKIAYVDVEGALDFDWATKIGVDLSDLYYVRPESAEQAADIVESLFSSGVFDIVVLDSLAAMTPEAELDGDMTDQQPGSHARVNNKMFRKVQASMNAIYNKDGEEAPTFFVINQERHKFGVTFGSNKTKPGGRGQDFYSTMELHTYSKGMQYFDKEHTMPKFGLFGFKVEKNKAAPPKVEGSFMLAVADDPEGSFQAGQLQEIESVEIYAERLGVFKQIDKTSWTMFDEKYKRKGDLIAHWYQNEENFAKLKRALLKRLFPKVFTHEETKKGRSSEALAPEDSSTENERES
jgi:recombination protein RecA